MKFNDFEYFTDTIFVSNLSRSVGAKAAVKAYKDVSEVVFNNVKNSRLQNKAIKLVDIFPIEEQNAVGVTVIMGNRTDLVIPRWVFEEGDDWRAIVRGKCDGSNKQSNAWLELEKSVNFNCPSPGLDCYLVDIELTYLTAWDNDGDDSYYGWNELNSNDPNPGDYKYDYATWRLYTCEGDDCDPATQVILDSEEYDYITCIDHNEMNYYSRNIENICENVAQGAQIFSHIIMQPGRENLDSLINSDIDSFIVKHYWSSYVYVGYPWGEIGELEE